VFDWVDVSEAVTIGFLSAHFDFKQTVLIKIQVAAIIELEVAATPFLQ